MTFQEGQAACFARCSLFLTIVAEAVAVMALAAHAAGGTENQVRCDRAVDALCSRRMPLQARF